MFLVLFIKMLFSFKCYYINYKNIKKKFVIGVNIYI